MFVSRLLVCSAINITHVIGWDMEASPIRAIPDDRLQFNYVEGSPMKCTLIVQNTSDHPVYIIIHSTLCRQLTIVPAEGKIEASQLLAVELMLQHEPHTNYAVEKLQIISSPRPFLYGYVTEHDCYRNVLSVTVESLPAEQDTRPEFVRVNESVNFKTTGNQLFKEGNFEAALEKYQQAIAIYRYDVRYYSNEVLALRKLRRYEEAVRITENILLFDAKNAKVLTAKSIIYAELSRMTDNLNEKLKLLKEALLLIESAKKLPAKNTSEESIFEVEAKLKAVLERVGAMSLQDLSAYLCERGKDPSKEEFKSRFETLFANEEEFRTYLGDALKVREVTPEYILDPLSYEIMKQPLIVPSGFSYDEQVLKQFFAYKGPIDPISKIPLNLNLIFPNRDLASYINNNEHLNQWREAEAQVLLANNDIEF